MFLSIKRAIFWKRLYLLTRLFSKLPHPPALHSLKDTTDFAAARQWVEAFRKIALQRDDVELTFARSSGPGGQASAR